MSRRVFFWLVLSLASGLTMTCRAQIVGKPPINELSLTWPNPGIASTHELTYNRADEGSLWVTGPEHDAIARVTLDLKPQFFKIRDGGKPHGIAFDNEGRLWLTLEAKDEVVQVDDKGNIIQRFNVRAGATKAVGPHGLAVGPDGRTIWFTGKTAGTVGRIDTHGKVEQFKLSSENSLPIFIKAGPDNNMWCTELVGNQIARITPNGAVTEFAIPTDNSRPIAVVFGPDGNSAWFSEEAGHKVGCLSLADGTIQEFPVPRTMGTMLLAGLAFDRDGNLWTQSYVDQQHPSPEGPDYIIKIDKSISAHGQAGQPGPQFNLYPVPSRKTVMHRIILGPDGNMWFTELKTDVLGKLTIANAR
jgi:virginiamycin B lyase